MSSMKKSLMTITTTTKSPSNPGKMTSQPLTTMPATSDEPEEEEGFVAASAEWDIEEYDTAYATYLDARRRFADLKLSRGYLPIVALQDDNAPKGDYHLALHRSGKKG